MANYATKDTVKAYGFANNDAALAGSDAIITESLERAEVQWNGWTGTSFYTQTVSSEIARNAFIDYSGFLWLRAIAAGPVTGVTQVQILDLMSANGSWQTAAWNSDMLLLPPATVPPDPNAWLVRILLNSPAISSRTVGQILVKWTYAGGYSTIPPALQACIDRLAWWNYKQREAPMAKIYRQELGVIEIPQNLPPDIRNDIIIWRRV